MKRLLLIFQIILFVIVSTFSQNVGIGTTTPQSRLEVKDTARTRLLISSKNYFDTSQLMLRNRNANNEGTDILFSSNNESGLRISSLSDLTNNTHDSIMQLTPQGRIGINRVTPQERLDVNGNINLSGVLKINNNQGTDKQVLKSNGDGTMQWEDMSSLVSSPSSGFGTWGDCATSNVIGAYQPVADTMPFGIGEYYGSKVSVSGNFAIVGGPEDFNYGAYRGAAFIYRFDGTKWIFMQKIVEPPASLDDNFGISVSISGNYAVIGIPQYANAGVEVGAASIYRYDGTNWVFMQRIINTGGTAGDGFGNSVSVSGTRLIIGAPYDDNGTVLNQGSVSIYQYNGSSWVLMQKILDASGADSDYFGYSVSISGDIAIAGAPNDDNGAFSNQGSASVYRYIAGNWALSIRTTNSSARAGVFWGKAVGISGTSIIVGAPGDIVGANTNQGTISFFDFNGANWIYGGKHNDPSGLSNDNFGSSVSISDDYAFAGGNFAQIGSNTFQGSGYIFIKYGLNIWQRLVKIIDPVGAAGDELGISVGIDASTKRFMIGAAGFNSGRGKVLFGKVN
jgi:hypothetical protein